MQPMYKEIKKCIICSGKLNQILDLGNQYVVDFVKEKDESLLQAPLVLMQCISCNFVQLKHRVNPDRLYTHMWYRSSINKMMQVELRRIVVNAISTIDDLSDGDAVLDIGCNDGTLLGCYPKGVRTCGIDPSGYLVDEGVKNGKIDFGIKDYFSYQAIDNFTSALGLNVPKFKIITAIAMFYDVENPVDFLIDCKRLLHEEGVLVIQMNYLFKMLQDTAFDNISHEHLGYYSVHTLNAAVEKAGLYLQGIEETPCNGGSIRAYITQKNFHNFSTNHSSNKLWLGTKMDRMKINEMKLYGSMVSNFEKDIKYKMHTIDMMIQSLDPSEKVYIYGASTRGTVTSQILGRKTIERIRGAAERDTNKIGLHMVGTWVPIVSEEEFRNEATYALVLPWHFKDGIIQREEAWLKKGGKFIFPLPKPEVVQHNTEVAFQIVGKLL